MLGCVVGPKESMLGCVGGDPLKHIRVGTQESMVGGNPRKHTGMLKGDPRKYTGVFKGDPK